MQANGISNAPLSPVHFWDALWEESDRTNLLQASDDDASWEAYKRKHEEEGRQNYERTMRNLRKKRDSRCKK